MIEIIKQLTSFPERQGLYVKQSEQIILGVLNRHGISYTLNKFTAETPYCTSELLVDGKNINCKGCSFVSGRITSKAHILSSMISSRFNLENANINFNPFSEAISCANFYFAPAVAIAKKDIPLIINSKNILGILRVNRVTTDVSHIIVGNIKTPRNIIFAHYDSISTGALDNASGVAVLLELIKNDKQLLKENLFVFDPQEELSFDRPTYWGRGFRVFESKFPCIMETAERLVIVDCVGNGSVFASSDPNILQLAFPIEKFENLKNKMITLYSDINGLFEVYHSSLDTPDRLEEKYLIEAVDLLKEILSQQSGSN